MKSFLLQAIACAAILFPAVNLDAKTFGGLKPGKTFTFTVNYRTSSKTTGTVTTQNAKIPDGIPKFKLGSKVTFTIGKKGELIAKDMSLPFKAVDTTSNPGRESNLYEAPPKKGYPFGDSGSLAKVGTKKPVGLSLSFNKIITTAGVSTQHRVFYALD